MSRLQKVETRKLQLAGAGEQLMIFKWLQPSQRTFACPRTKNLLFADDSFNCGASYSGCIRWYRIRHWLVRLQKVQILIHKQNYYCPTSWKHCRTPSTHSTKKPLPLPVATEGVFMCFKNLEKLIRKPCLAAAVRVCVCVDRSSHCPSVRVKNI